VIFLVFDVFGLQNYCFIVLLQQIPIISCFALKEAKYGKWSLTNNYCHPDMTFYFDLAKCMTF
jgi:hypothetical protein